MTTNNAGQSFYRKYAAVRMVTAFPGVTRRLLGSGEHISLVEITIEAGHDVPEHVHPHEQAGQVIAGRARFRIAGQETELTRNDSYLIPGGVSHHVVAIEPTVLVEAFAPIREDFLGDLKEAERGRGNP